MTTRTPQGIPVGGQWIVGRSPVLIINPVKPVNPVKKGCTMIPPLITPAIGATSNFKHFSLAIQITAESPEQLQAFGKNADFDALYTEGCPGCLNPLPLILENRMGGKFFHCDTCRLNVTIPQPDPDREFNPVTLDLRVTRFNPDCQG